jgi:hypothetical protein
MEPIVVVCPACLFKLRVREREFLDRPVACPECGVQIQIDTDPSQPARVRRIAGPDTTADRPAASPKKSALSRVAPAARGTDSAAGSESAEPDGTAPRRSLFVSPRLAAWAGAVTVAVVLLGWAWVSRPARVDSAVAQHPPVAETSSGGPPGSSTGSTAPGGSSPDGTPTTKAASPETSPPGAKPTGTLPKATIEPGERDPVAMRLMALGETIRGSVDTLGEFPRSATVDLPAPKRLGWLAALGTARGPTPQWELPWNDPANDPFVRRRRDELLNPRLSRLVGDDGYPATHFAGNAGVGVGARRLRVDEPGAGAFGEDRRTTVDDFRDGLGNTVMVFGVQERLGSWATNDDATLRELTREPFVNGPDGLGTGQPDSMLVLMADGSVRTIQQSTDAQLVRRMATLWDRTEGEAGDDPPLVSQSPAPTSSSSVATAPGATSPEMTKPEKPNPTATVSVPDDEPKVPAGERPAAEGDSESPRPVEVVIRKQADVEEVLRRKILRYEVAKPVARVVLLRELADSAGVPLLWNEEDLGDRKTLLDERTVMKFGPGELGQLMREILPPNRLGLEARDGGVWIVPKR